jgi:hypothetical protein
VAQKFTFVDQDGNQRTIEGPDGATREQAFAMLQKSLAEKPIAKSAAEKKVAADRAAKPEWARTLNDKLHQIASVTVPFADELRAKIGPLAGGGTGTYEENLAEEVAKGEAADKDSTKYGTLPVIGDVTSGTVAKVGAGVGAALVTPAARVFSHAPQIVNGVRQAGAMLPRIADSALNAGFWGGIFGASSDKEDRLRGAAAGTGMGLGFGAVAPPIATGIGNLYQTVRNSTRGVPTPLRRYQRGSVERVGRAIADDDIANTYQRQSAELGPEAMLADMGDNLSDQAGAIANQPGQGQRTIRQALRDRHDTAAGRITGDIDNALGPAANIPETVEATAQASRAAAAPHRQQFQNTPVPLTPQLEGLLEHIRENSPAVLTEARRYANEWARINGTRPQFFARQNAQGGWDIERIPNATEWDHIKRAFDDMADPAKASRTDQTIYGNLARSVRDTVDEALSPGAPAQSPWAQARGLERDNFQIQEAVDEGASAFAKNLTPDQMRARMHGVGPQQRGAMTPHELQGYQVGARDNVRQIMGNASTQWGENSAPAVRSALGSNNAREKIGLIAQNQRAADELIRRLDAETQNSRTAGRIAAQEEFPNAVAAPIGTDTTLTGIVIAGGRKLANALWGGAVDERRARIAADAARLLTAQGPQRDQLVRALLSHARSRNMGARQRAELIRAIEALTSSSSRPTVDSITSTKPLGSGYASGISSILEDDARKRKP